MFYDRADNCCRLVRGILDGGPDGGACPPDPSATCRGFTGVCSDLPDQFASLPVLPDYPNGLQDFVCHAFPDDDSPLARRSALTRALLAEMSTSGALC
jgi:hypothetical protein